MTVRLLAVLSSLALAVVVELLTPSRGTAQWLELDVRERPTADAAIVEAGREIYQERCWFCHGEDGDGSGPIAAYLWPRPRDFTAGSYKLRTTESGELPTDEDLFRTISLGIPGTAMPGWQSVLSPRERWRVIAYLKTFAADLFEDAAFDPYQVLVELGGPPAGPVDALVAEGEQVYEEADCWECHGARGRGDGEKAAELKDDWEVPIWPADLSLGWKYKGGSTPREVYLRLTTGLDGTPMPSYSETVSEERRWQLAYYVASLQGGAASKRATGIMITAHRLDGAVPASPDDPVWQRASEMSIPLTGQATFAPRWQVPAVTDLAVRAVYNAEDIALRLAWNDRFVDTLLADSARAALDGWRADDTYPMVYPAGGPVGSTYADAAEIMFPVRHQEALELPHFVYGNAGQPVDLWRWRAELPQREGPGSAVVEFQASGVRQRPEPHPAESQRAAGRGVWQDGRWTVVVRRPLRTEDGLRDVQLRPGEVIPVAFHVWDGANGETGLRMALSSWYFLHLREPARAVSYLVVLVAVLGVLITEYGVVRWMKHLARGGRLARYGIEPGPSGTRAGE